MGPVWRACVAWTAMILLLSCASAHKPASTETKPPDSAGTGVPAGPQQQFVPTPELYTRTFDEVKQIIANLTALINAQDYDGWRAYLTAEYITRTSDPSFLAEASHSGVLQKSGIVLRTLRDYFENVVVRSRVQASLDDITFVDETHVKALTIVDGRPVILYYLVREDGGWKVGTWPADYR